MTGAPFPAVRVDLALVHHPIRTRDGGVGATAVTNMDIHDIARAARTYGVEAYHIVTPIAAQRRLVEGVTAHWRGEAGVRVPPRAEALARVRVASRLEEVSAAIEREAGERPFRVATAADPRGRDTLSFAGLRDRLARPGPPVLLVFGTGWGLADELLDGADALLDPLRGPGAYNHLSVRVAVGIALDRILGRPEGC